MMCKSENERKSEMKRKSGIMHKSEKERKSGCGRKLVLILLLMKKGI